MYGDQLFEDELEGEHIPAFAREWGGSRYGGRWLPVGLDPRTGTRAATEDEAVAEIRAEMPSAAAATTRYNKLQQAATEDEAVAEIRAEITAAAAASHEAAANKAGECIHIHVCGTCIFTQTSTQQSMYTPIDIKGVYIDKSQVYIWRYKVDIEKVYT